MSEPVRIIQQFIRCCDDCPHFNYYSGGMYECELTREPMASKQAKGGVGMKCPLPFAGQMPLPAPPNHGGRMTDTETDAEFLKRMSESNEYGRRDCAYSGDFFRLLALATRGAAIPDERKCHSTPFDYGGPVVDEAEKPLKEPRNV